MARIFKKFIWLIPAGAAIALYWRTLRFEYVWDDRNILFQILPNFHSPLDVFKPLTVFVPLHYYRPLPIISWLTDASFWGANPMGYHLTAILLHAINAVLVFFLVKVLLSRHELAWLGATAAALVFAVHPAQTESVCWIAARPELLFTAFSLTSFLLFLSFRRTSRKEALFWSVLCWFFALLSKETAVSLFPCLILYDIFFTNVSKKNKIRSYACYAGVFVIYLYLRSRYLLHGEAEVAGAWGGEIVSRIASAIIFYFKALFFPVPQNSFVYELIASPASIVLVLAGFGVVVLSFTWLFRRGYRFFLFALCFFALTILPAVFVAISNVSQLPAAERYLYLPMFAFSLLVGVMIVHETHGRTGVFVKAALFIPIIVAFYYITSLKIPDWRNDLTYFSPISERYPDKGGPYEVIGNYYLYQKDYQKAIYNYDKAISTGYTKEGRLSAYNNLGIVYTRLKEYKKAEEVLQNALREEDVFYLYLNLGNLYLEMADEHGGNGQEELKKAIYNYKECLRRVPGFQKALDQLKKAEKQLNNG